MSIGQPILVAAALAGMGTLAVGIWGRRPSMARGLSWLLLLLAATGALVLAVHLVTGDFSVRYVWQHSASYQSLRERISALVAGPEGSLLMWLLLAAAVAVWSAERHLTHGWSGRGGGRAIHLAVVSVAALLAAVTLATTPFQTLADFASSAGGEGVGAVEGRGLNPVLGNAWMAPHTFLTLGAFALIGLAASIALVQLYRAARAGASHGADLDVERIRTARWAWIVLTLALFAGIVWAYEEMSFGWFWSWDPVESATLAVWLVLTAALHAPRGATAVGRIALLGPALTVAAFATALFASVVARSGLHPSVHAFAGGPAGAILGGLLAIVLVLLGVSLVAAWRRTGQEARDLTPTRTRLPVAAWAAAALLAAAGGLVVWGLAFPVVASRVFGSLMDLDAHFFALSGYGFAIAALMLMGAGLSGRGRSGRDRLVLFGLFSALTVVAAFVKPVDGLMLLRGEAGPLLDTLGQISILSLLPATVYALLGIVERWGSRPPAAVHHGTLAATGHATLHAGVLSVLLGVTFSTLFATSTTVAVRPDDGMATAMADPQVAAEATRGLGVRITQLVRNEDRNALDELVELRETATLEVRLDGRTIAIGEAGISTYPGRDMGRHARVLLERGLLHDTQVIYHGLADAQAAGIPVTIRRVPLTNLVWAGMAAFVVGMALQLLRPVGPRVAPERGQ